MKKNFSYFLILFATFWLSCEKVIDVPLEEADRRIVIEMEMKNAVGANYLKISKTGSVYDDSGFEKLSGAIVTIKDELGSEYVFPELAEEPGTYSLPSFKAEPNTTYELTIEVEGQTITSISTTGVIPSLDELYYTVEPNFFAEFLESEEDSIIQVFFDFSDNGSQKNYYQIKAWVNGERDETAYLFDDQLFSGENIVATLFGAEVYKGDTVVVELVSMDEGNYDFWYTLDNANAVGGFSSAPANPISNIKGDAIGYFGAYTTDTMTIVIPE